MNNDGNLLDILKTLSVWKWKLLGLTLIVGVLTAIITWFFLPNFYKASTTFVASSTSLASPKVIFGGSQYGIGYYGNDDDNERIISISGSDELFDYLIEEFNLYEHYGIDPEAKRAKFKVKMHLKELYEVLRTKHESISLSIEDEDPEFSARMANSARDKINDISNQMIKSSLGEVLEILQKNIQKNDARILSLGDSLVSMRNEYGVYNISTQSEMLAEMVASTETNLTTLREKVVILEKDRRIPRDTITYMKAEIKGLEKKLESLTSEDSDSELNLTRFNTGMARIQVLEQEHAQTRNQLSFDKERLQQIQSAYNSDVPALLVIERASTPLIKSRPKRSIMVLTAMMITFILGAIGILLFENYKGIDWKGIWDAG